MAALGLNGILRLHETRSGLGLPQAKRNSKPLGGWNGAGFGFHSLPRLGGWSYANGWCFLRITSSRAGQIQGKELQVVAVRSEEEKAAGGGDAVGFGVVKGVAKSVMEAVCAVQKPAMVALLFCLLVSQGPEMAVAASGGRVGGNSFRSYYSYSLSLSEGCVTVVNCINALHNASFASHLPRIVTLY